MGGRRVMPHDRHVTMLKLSKVHSVEHMLLHEFEGVTHIYVVRRVWLFFFSSRRRHTRLQGDWSSDVCSSDLTATCTSNSRLRKGQTPRRKLDLAGYSWPFRERPTVLRTFPYPRCRTSAPQGLEDRKSVV